MSDTTTAVKEHGTMFSGDAPRKILKRLKWQTRRPVKWSNTLVDGGWRHPKRFWDEFDFNDALVDSGTSLKVTRGGPTRHRLYPMWAVGDRLWVREAYSEVEEDTYLGGKLQPKIWYSANNDRPMWADRPWRNPMYMPRRASRILLEVTAVRVERVQDISEEDAKAEGCRGHEWYNKPLLRSYEGNRPSEDFEKLWDSIYAKKPEYQWEKNVWAWVREFKVIETEKGAAH